MIQTRTLSGLVVISILILSMITTPQTSIARRKPITFSPLLEICIDDSNIENKPLQPFVTVKIPITVKLKPGKMEIMRVFPPLLRNLLLYKMMISPPIEIRFSIKNKPQWLEAFFTSPEVYLDLDFKNGVSCDNTTLVVSLHRNAPAQPYQLIIKAETQTIGRVKKTCVETPIVIHPAYVPYLEIHANQDVRTVRPKEKTTFAIEITNRGNGKSKIQISYDLPDNWSEGPVTIRTPIILSVNETATVLVDVIPPADFEKKSIEKIDLNFTVGPAFPYPFSPSFAFYHKTLYLINTDNN